MVVYIVDCRSAFISRSEGMPVVRGEGVALVLDLGPRNIGADYGRLGHHGVCQCV